VRELERKINNIVQIGTIVEIDNKKALARVNILGRVTDFLPVKMIGNSFIKVFIPVRIGEQVMVVCPYGNANSGYVIPSIFNRNLPEPSGATEDKAIVEFAGGVRIDSDGANITINVPENVNITCTNANVKADNVKVDSPSIDMGLGGKGVVTGECICAFTGKPHHDYSANTRSAK